MNTTLIYSPHRNPFIIKILTTLYILNEKTLNHSWTNIQLWDAIKIELFWISGDCQLSGNCCKTIMLYKNRKPIDNKKSWLNLLKKEKKYTPFYPEYTNTKKNKISYFNCKNLKDDNTCRDYKNRPDFCKNYPISNFIGEYALHNSCGFRVLKTDNKEPKVSLQLEKKITHFKSIFRIP